MAWTEFDDDDGCMQPGSYGDHAVNVAEELCKFTFLQRDHSELLVDCYSECRANRRKGWLLSQAEKEAAFAEIKSGITDLTPMKLAEREAALETTSNGITGVTVSNLTWILHQLLSVSLVAMLLQLEGVAVAMCICTSRPTSKVHTPKSHLRVCCAANLQCILVKLYLRHSAA